MVTRFALFTTLALIAVALLAAPAFAGPADKARLAAKQDRWQDAADAWIEVLDKQASNKEAAIGLATAVRKGFLVDLYVQAEEALQSVLEKQSKDRDARLALGELFIAQAKTKSDPTAMKFTYEDAKTQFTKLLEANSKDEDAAVGVARTHYWTAYFSDALMVLDEFLAGGTSRGPALFWRGQIYYLQAQDAMRQAGSVDESAKALFRKAMEAYGEATKANPKYFEALMQYAYAAQYLGDEDSTKLAEQAYEKAMALQPESVGPLKGIEALYRYRADEYVPRLQELAKQVPANKAVYFYLGFAHLVRESWDDSVKAFETYVKTSKSPQGVWTWLGKAYEGQGKDDKAADAYRKGLLANPADTVAAANLEKRIVASHGNPTGWTPKDAEAFLADYRELFKLAPDDPWIRNNAAFVLRESIGALGSGSARAKVLDACIEVYTDASGIAEGHLQGRESSLPYATLYQYAGVLSDTGLMFQYYPTRKDLEKAEDHYLRALELTNDGYRDAWENLTKVYLEQGRWQEAYELCRDCAERMTLADGSPHPHRAAASSKADELMASGRVTAD